MNADFVEKQLRACGLDVWVKADRRDGVTTYAVSKTFIKDGHPYSGKSFYTLIGITDAVLARPDFDLVAFLADEFTFAWNLKCEGACA